MDTSSKDTIDLFFDGFPTHTFRNNEFDNCMNAITYPVHGSYTDEEEYQNAVNEANAASNECYNKYTRSIDLNEKIRNQEEGYYYYGEVDCIV